MTPSAPDHRDRSRARQALGAMRSHVQPGSFPLLLAAALLLYVLNGLAADTMGGAILERVGRVGVLCAGLYVLSTSRTTLWLGMLVAGLALSLELRLWGFPPRLDQVLQDSLMVGKKPAVRFWRRMPARASTPIMASAS